MVAGCGDFFGSDSVDPASTPTRTPTPSPTPTADRSVWLKLNVRDRPVRKRWEEDIVPAVRNALGIELELTFPCPPGATCVSFSRVVRDSITQEHSEWETPEGFTGALSHADAGAFLARGWLDPVTATVDRIEDRLGPLLGSPAVIDGEHYVLPQELRVPTIHYRADLLAEHGLDPPRTLETLLENTRVIEAADGPSHGFVMPSHSLFESFVTLLLNAYGVCRWEWADREARVPTVALPQAKATEAVRYLRRLGQYAVPVESVEADVGGLDRPLQAYASGETAQLFHVNAFGAGMAATFENDTVVRSTEILPFPRNRDHEAVVGEEPAHFGYFAIGPADGRSALEDLFGYLYRDAERVPRRSETHPTLSIPAWLDVIESERYRGHDRFADHPHLWNLVETVHEDVASDSVPGADTVLTPATVYADSRRQFRALQRDLLEGDGAVETAVRETRERLASHLAEGRRLHRNQTDG